MGGRVGRWAIGRVRLSKSGSASAAMQVSTEKNVDPVVSAHMQSANQVTDAWDVSAAHHCPVDAGQMCRRRLVLEGLQRHAPSIPD